MYQKQTFSYGRLDRCKQKQDVKHVNTSHRDSRWIFYHIPHPLPTCRGDTSNNSFCYTSLCSASPTAHRVGRYLFRTSTASRYRYRLDTNNKTVFVRTCPRVSRSRRPVWNVCTRLVCAAFQNVHAGSAIDSLCSRGYIFNRENGAQEYKEPSRFRYSAACNRVNFTFSLALSCTLKGLLFSFLFFPRNTDSYTVGNGGAVAAPTCIPVPA